MAYGSLAEEDLYEICDQKAKSFDFIYMNFLKLFRKIQKVFWEKTRKNEKACKKIHKKSVVIGSNDMYMIRRNAMFSSFSKKMKKSKKILKNFLKKYWQMEKYMIYYMSARRKSDKNNGPWKLNNNKQEWIKFSLITLNTKY